MDEWVTLADASGRNIPILWIGPNAAGHHLQPPGGQVTSTQATSALWQYTLETMKEAKARQLDALGMYNLTLQANSWDGNSYGQRVGLVQAMMVKHAQVEVQSISNANTIVQVINWLSRVEST